MKPPRLILPASPWRSRLAEQGGVRSILLPLICFALGLAVSALWSQRASHPVPGGQTSPELSESTGKVLEHLTQPVEIRFYSLLDPSAPASLAAFAQRVDQLLSVYQQRANGKIVLTGLSTQTNTSPDAALADGIKGFDLDKGEGCFLGVALSCAGKKEVLSQLSPEWEPALEADVTRAIQRVNESAARGQVAVGATPIGADVVEQIRQRIPNLDSVPLNEAIRSLREDSIKEFTTAAAEMQTRVQEAQARLVQAKNGGSAAEQDVAMKGLQAAQAEQARRLKEIAANSQARIEAAKQLKSSGK